ALLRQELEESLVTHSLDFQNTSEPSNASTNVVNTPREPYVVKQDNGSFIDEIIFDLNRAPDSPNQFHCFHCKDVLRDGEACKRCTCVKCESGLGKVLCYIFGHNQNSLNDSPSISKTSSQSPPNINHCCYECGDPLDGIFCKRCTCKSCGKDAHIGYNYPSKVLVISIPEPCNNQTINELPQALPIFHPTFHSEAECPFTLDSTPTYVDESPNVFNPPPQPPVYPCEFCEDDAYFGHYCIPQAPFIYPEPCYNQDFNFPQNFQNVPQQYPCCEDCGFAGELTLLKSFPPGIDKTDCHPEKEIRLTKRLLYDNSSPRPPEEIVSDNSNADIESFSPPPIPNLDSDPLMEEIDLFLNLDDPMPPGIVEDDDDSERDIPILEELLDNYSLSLPTTETRRQLETDGEMCMFALTVSRTEPKNIKEAMVNSAWIEAMQEELHQFVRLDVWKLVDKPLCKIAINMKWIKKNKHEEKNIVICNKDRLVAKGYNQHEGINFEESFAPVA
nr:Gag-Pol polyprotein [Tanacetum cinerariifolium]